MNTVNELSPNESQTESSPLPPSLLTCVSSYSPVRLESTQDLRIFLQQVGPANPTVLQETEEAWLTSERDGLTSSTSSARLDPDGSWVKMCQGFVQPTLDGTLEPFSETWPKAGMTVDGEYYPQPKWEARISEIGSGLWPTATTRDWKNGKASQATLERNSRPLSEVVVQRESERWPTPKSQSNRNSRSAIIDKKGGGTHKSSLSLEQAVEVQQGILPRELESVEELPPKYRDSWPTPTVSGMVTGGPNHNSPSVMKGKHGLNLGGAAQRWPTPTVDDSKQGEKARQSGNHQSLAREVGGSLNPTFVEWLMNFPKGWTSLEPIDPNDVSAWEADAPASWAEEWEGVSRLTDDKTDRVARLKALGNAQVPLCVAVAWKLLTEDWA